MAESISIEEYKRIISQQKPKSKNQAKFRNIRTKIDGIKFDSKKERDRYLELKIMERVGIIRNLELQVTFVIADGIKGDADLSKDKKYVADFAYFDVETGGYIVEDVKSPVTRKAPLYLLKKQLMLLCHGIKIQEI